MPAFLLVKTLSGPRVTQFNPFRHFLQLFSFLLLVHVSSLSSLLDLSEAKIININRLPLNTTHSKTYEAKCGGVSRIGTCDS